jgi:metal-sulfur cluster biosynthetic enzyme
MVTKDQVFEALRAVYDPELGVNVVDLGLIYGVDIADNTVDVTMTMTTPGCPLHHAITRGVQMAVGMLPDVHEARVELVWTPPWEPEMMSEAARQALC